MLLSKGMVNETSENKGYRFKMEFTETDYFEEEGEKYDIKFTSYGDSAKETVRQLDELRNEYHEFIHKWEDKHMKSIGNRNDLK